MEGHLIMDIISLTFALTSGDEIPFMGCLISGDTSDSSIYTSIKADSTGASQRYKNLFVFHKKIDGATLTNTMPNSMGFIQKASLEKYAFSNTIVVNRDGVLAKVPKARFFAEKHRFTQRSKLN